MNYKKVILSTATLSLGVSSSAGAVDINQNKTNYIKLAAIIPVAELDSGVILSSERYSDDEMIRKACVAKGFVEGLDCPPTGQDTLCVKERCVDDTSSVGYDYVKCTCYCNGENTCKEMGYASSCLDGYKLDTSDKCPIDTDYKKCIPNPCTGYYTSCSSGYTKNTSDTCKSGSTTKYKCIANPCVGYDKTSCGTGYYSTGSCLSGSTTKYKCSANTCDGYDKTSPCSPSSGYTQTTCQSGSTTKYKCVAKPCNGYDYTTCPSGYLSKGTCQSGGTLKYGCDPNPCKGFDKTSACSPSSGYTQTTCQSGSTTKYKCVANTCSGYVTSCSSGYVKNTSDTCQAGGTLKYKCKADPCTGYTYTSCPSGYIKDDSCLSGTTTKYKCSITDAQRCKDAGYYKTSCSTGYYLFNKCSYADYYKICAKTDGLKCTEAGYSKSTTSCSKYYKLANCDYDGAYKKCIDKTNGEKCITDGYSNTVTSCGEITPLTDNQKCFERGYIYDSCTFGVSGSACPYNSSLKRCLRQEETDCSSTCQRWGYSYGSTGYSCCMGLSSSSCFLPGGETYRVCQNLVSLSIGDINAEAARAGCSEISICDFSGKQLPTEQLEDCSFDSNYKKCVPIELGNLCELTGYSQSTTIKDCAIGQQLVTCLSDSTYKKCSDMSNGEKCIAAGYVKNKTCLLGETTQSCLYDNTYKRCVAVVLNDCIRQGYSYHGPVGSGEQIKCAPGYTTEDCPTDSDYKKCVDNYNCNEWCESRYGLNTEGYRCCAGSGLRPGDNCDSVMTCALR